MSKDALRPVTRRRYRTLWVSCLSCLLVVACTDGGASTPGATVSRQGTAQTSVGTHGSPPCTSAPVATLTPPIVVRQLCGYQPDAGVQSSATLGTSGSKPVSGCVAMPRPLELQFSPLPIVFEG